MHARDLAAWRLHSLGLSRPAWASPEAVVAGLLGVQAENRPQAGWALAARTAGTVTEDDVARALDDGTILRTHVLRPTWHFVLPDDIRWLVELTAPRVRRLADQQQRALGITDATLDAAVGEVVDALAGGEHLTRAELGERLADAGLPVEGRALSLVVFVAEMDALVCSGVERDGQHTYALLAERAPQARRLERDEALAEVARRYVAGHGPVTERDLAYWASLTLTDVRSGLAAADGLDRLEHDGRTYWVAGPPPDDLTPRPRAHLLQVLDEYHNGVQDSRDLLDLAGVVPRGRPATTGMVLVDGQMVGGMRRTVRASAVEFVLDLHRDLATGEHEAVHEAADRYAAFLGRDPRVS